ncbi:MAG: substrate-binding domain-containing protein [Anaerolineae bacterium]
MTTTFERRQAIVRVLEEKPGIKTVDLAQLLDVSIGTIRNDLSALQNDGKVTRVHGGAVLVAQNNLARSDGGRNELGKRRMAKRAVEMISNGDAIWLDAGTTAQALIPLLAQRRNLTVVTNGLRVAVQLAEQELHQVLLIGGRVGKDGIYTIGTGNERLLDTVNIQTAFVSGVGFTLEAGLTVLEYEDAQIKMRVINSAENVVALIDASKIGKRGFAPVANMQQLTHFVTDKDMSAVMLRQLRRMQINVTICGRNTIRSHTIADGQEKFVIGFANQTEQAPFAIDVRRGLEQAAAERQDIDLVISDNKLSGAEALRVANHLIERRVDLAIEYQIDYRSGNLIIDKFQRVNIPVIAVDIPMVGATYFGVDNYRGGYMAGEVLGNWVLENWHGEIERLVVLEENRAGDLPRARIHGQLDALQELVGEIPAENVITLDSGNTLLVSQNNFKKALQEMAQVQKIAVVSFNDEAAVGAVRAARELGRSDDIVVIGQGGDQLGREELRRPDSRLIGTTAYMPERYGAKLIEIAANILQGISVPPAIYIEHVFLTYDNLDQFYPT